LTKCSLHLTAEYVVKKLPIAEYSVVKKPKTCCPPSRLSPLRRDSLRHAGLAEP
jgi:hypothetical protein